MSIHYLDPVDRGWKRMIKHLFKPFDLKAWFIIGFGAFLDQLTDFSNKYDSSDSDDYSGERFGEILEAPYEFWEWLMSNHDWFNLIIFGIIVIIIISVLLTWLSSRGKFIFLDNVVHERALFKQPWSEFRDAGNSLFFWRYGFGIVILLAIGSFLVSGYLDIYRMYQNFAPDSELIWAAIRTGVVVLLLGIIAAYISLFLNDFIVPIMYKNRTRAWIAWGQFIPTLRAYLGNFLLYGIFVLFLYLIVAALIVAFGLITCCIGFIILIIPYIGSVLTLPISYTFRAFSVEFLQQFGPEFKIFPDLESSEKEVQ